MPPARPGREDNRDHPARQGPRTRPPPAPQIMGYPGDIPEAIGEAVSAGNDRAAKRSYPRTRRHECCDQRSVLAHRIPGTARHRINQPPSPVTRCCTIQHAQRPRRIPPSTARRPGPARAHKPVPPLPGRRSGAGLAEAPTPQPRQPGLTARPCPSISQAHRHEPFQAGSTERVAQHCHLSHLPSRTSGRCHRRDRRRGSPHGGGAGPRPHDALIHRHACSC